MIDKIKIDLILERKSCESLFTDYLDLYKDCLPKDIRYMNDLLLSNLIHRNIETEDFMS